MIQISERAANYAAENANKVVNDALAQAYADGFRDGYKTREEEIPVDLRDNKTEYVDLGLPSGTLWAKDYERDGENVMYVPYGVAKGMCIPSEEQWHELMANCKKVFEKVAEKNSSELMSVSFVGKNGNYIKFQCTGRIEAENNYHQHCVYFWINDDNQGSENKKVVELSGSILGTEVKTTTVFQGFKLPIRLIRNI